jgi:signal transduction histidine kinase
VSIRTRIALGFVVTIAALFAATSLTTYLVVRSRLDAQAAASATRLARAAAVAEPDEAQLDRLAGPGDRIWLVSSSGQLVASSYRSGAASAAEVSALERRPPAGATPAVAQRPGGGTAVVLAGGHERQETLHALRRTIAIVGGLALVAAALLGSLLAAGALRPVERLRRQVDEIPGEALDRRVAEGRPDELGRLARAFNRLLNRAADAAEEQQRFVADASHELKTPITALQGHARIVARAAERGDLAQARESALVVEQQTQRLAETLADLLALAELGSGARQHVPVRLDRVVADVCDERTAIDPTRPFELDIAEATVSGDPRRLSELVRTLVDNASKYSPPDTPITITVTGGSAPTLSIRDRGAGLTAEDQARAFDRFYRGSASSSTPGSGLGLAIAREICDRHGATLSLDPAPTRGLVATATFPRTPT